jgi:type II secretory pathway pseudopilin PulG
MTRQNDANEAPPTGRCDLRRAFTLTELVVAIGVVIFLFALTLSAGVALARKSDVRQTENTIRLLDMALQEWELAADRKLTWGPDPARFDIYKDRAYTLVITEMLGIIRRSPRVKTILAQIEPGSIYTYDVEAPFPAWIEADYRATQQLPEFDGGITVLDAWGTPVYSTHPGATAAPGVQPVDTDGTERTLNESYYGIARNRQVCFVSAGPDRLFGLYWEFTGLTGPQLEEAMAEAMKDNIYSYTPESPQTTGYPGR